MRHPSSSERGLGVKIKILLAFSACGLIAGGCAIQSPETESARLLSEALKSSFKSQGQAGIERLNQDEVQAACSQYRNVPPPDLAEKIRRTQAATIKYPDNIMGDWRAGERIAQSGRGKTFTDELANPVGGNCYACHQLSPQEFAFGTIGPSLSRYGKLRGAGDAVQRATYAKVYNPQATNACSFMPRFGHGGVLSPEQISNVVALLLDPESPVNK
jgi:sulfur-oxidizing protein SoxX